MADPDESICFYACLGFEVFEQKPDGYTTLINGPAVVALSPVSMWPPGWWLGFLRQPPIGTEIVFYSERLEELREALEGGGYAPGPIRLQPWGNLDFRVRDPDGYYVRISEGRAAAQPK